MKEYYYTCFTINYSLNVYDTSKTKNYFAVFGSWKYIKTTLATFNAKMPLSEKLNCIAVLVDI